MQDLKELNEVIAAIKEEIRQGADALTTSRSVYEFKKTFLTTYPDTYTGTRLTGSRRNYYTGNFTLQHKIGRASCRERV